MNRYRDCITDENDQIVAERPRFITDWVAGDEICKVFNEGNLVDEVCEICDDRDALVITKHCEVCGEYNINGF